MTLRADSLGNLMYKPTSELSPDDRFQRFVTLPMGATDRQIIEKILQKQAD